ncbi:MAG: DNA primase family protein, partial [Pseudolabrys sp.]
HLSCTHWQFEDGAQAAALYAQHTAPRIQLEADYLTATPSEAKAIEAAEEAFVALERLKKDKKKPTKADLKEMARLDYVIERGKYAAEELKKRQTRRRAFAVSSGNDNRLRAMLNQAAPHRTVAQDQLDAEALAFNTANGTLRFECHAVPDPECPDPDVDRMQDIWVVRHDAHAPGDLISKVSPVEYDRNATAPKFLASLERFQPNAEKRHWLHKYYGYGITGLNGEQCLVFNGGGGSNWKSTFTEIVFRVIGDYGATLKFESLAGEGATTGAQASPDIARLPRARLVRASEPDRGAQLKESLIKALTGGEPMITRHNFGNFFQFYPVFKLSLSGNDKPEIGGVDHGIWRRWRYIVWPVTIADDERREFDEVIAELWEERAGILNWLIDGALLYL